MFASLSRTLPEQSIEQDEPPERKNKKIGRDEERKKISYELMRGEWS